MVKLQARLQKDCKNQLKQILLAILLVLIGSWYLVSAVIPNRMDADLLVPSLSSLNNPTLFYWGQDRMFSLITFLILPFRDLQWNIYLNTFFHASFFSALVLLIAWNINSSPARLTAGFIGSLIAIRYIIPDYELFWFAKHAQPYASSITIAALGYLITTRYNNSRTSSRLTGIVFPAISILLNPIAIAFQLFLPLDTDRSARRNLSIVRINTNSLQWFFNVACASLVLIIVQKFYAYNYDISRTSYGIEISTIPATLWLSIGNFYNSYQGEDSLLRISVSALCFMVCIFSSFQSLSCISKFDQFISLEKVRFFSCAACLNLLTLIPILGSEWFKINLYSLRYLFPIYLVVITGVVVSTFIAIEYLVNRASRLAISLLAISNQSSKRYIVYLVFTLMSAAIIGSLRPIAPSLLTYAEISRVQPLHSYLKSNTDTPLYLGGSYWLCWPYKIYALWKGENIGVITDRSQFDPASKQEELNLNNSITLGQEFYYACLSEKDSSSECQKDINHRIDQLTGKSREWGSEVVNKGAFRINGESYIYIMRYAKHGHKA